MTALSSTDDARERSHHANVDAVPSTPKGLDGREPKKERQWTRKSR